jgi:uncharacterized protein (TIGR03067 family)
MKQFLLVLVMLGLGLPACVGSGEGKEDGQLMEGTWLPVEAELAGAKFPDEILKTMKLTMKEDQYTVTVGGKIDRGTFKLESTANPRSIDITGTDGPNRGKTLLAIYEISDDTLRVCYDLAGKKRPAEFKTEKETKQYLVKYKREKN